MGASPPRLVIATKDGPVSSTYDWISSEVSLAGVRVGWSDGTLRQEWLAGTYQVFLFGRPQERYGAAPRWEIPAHGPVPLSRYDGSFAAVAFDRRDSRIYIGTDRYASFLLYGCRTPAGLTAVASDPLTAMQCGALEPKVDVIAAVQWLSFGYIPSDRTLVEKVRLLGYGRWFELSAARTTRYWSFNPRPSSAAESELKQEIDALDEREDEAIRRTYSSAEYPPIVLLSGGWDSRALASRIRRQMPKADIRALSFGAIDSQDVRIAEDVAASLGLAWGHRGYDFSSADTSLREWAALHLDLSDNVFATLPGGTKQLASEGPGTFWLGTDSFSTVLPDHIPGREELVGKFLLPDASERLLETLWLMIGAVSRKSFFPGWMLNCGAVRASYSEVIWAAFNEILALASKQPSEPLDHAFDRVSHETRFRVWNINRRLYEMTRPTVTPFHDVDLVEWYAELPQRIRGERWLHKRTNEDKLAAFGHAPLHSGSVSIDILSAVRDDEPLRRLMIERISRNSITRRIVDAEALLANFEKPAMRLLTLRAYLVATICDTASLRDA